MLGLSKEQPRATPGKHASSRIPSIKQHLLNLSQNWEQPGDGECGRAGDALARAARRAHAHHRPDGRSGVLQARHLRCHPQGGAEQGERRGDSLSDCRRRRQQRAPNNAWRAARLLRSRLPPPISSEIKASAAERYGLNAAGCVQTLTDGAPACAGEKGKSELFLKQLRERCADIKADASMVHVFRKETCAIHAKALEEAHGLEAAFPDLVFPLEVCAY
eukprot:3542787-Pleurochrysis_carterae.AAC.7